MTPKPPWIDIELAPRQVVLERRDDGGFVLRSAAELQPFEAHLGLLLRRWASARPDRVFLEERRDDGWRRLTWGEALRGAEAVGQALAVRGLDRDRPLMILSGNSIDHALSMLGGFLSGVPVAPVSPAYSLLSSDHAKLRHVVAQLRPAMIFVESLPAFARALSRLDLDGIEVVASGPDPGSATPLARLLATEPGTALREAESRVGPGSVAKYLLTSGSTGIPKAVINTHRMLCANQQMIAQCWPFLGRTTPRLVDWLPWNHTFGGNHNFNLILKHGGCLTIDGGKPRPEAIGETVRNLREVSPNLYFNVPAGFAQLLPFLESDRALCDAFFRDLQLIFYAGAALPQDLWDRLERLSILSRGGRVLMTSAWGSTETAPLATSVHYPIERAGVIGLPAPGVEIKAVPAGSKLELRVRGPSVFPGYFEDPQLTVSAFDREGFYKIGDAGHLLDPDDPARGLVFDGRVAENFKLLSGTWVTVGDVRVQALAAAAPVLADAIVTGHDRSCIGLLAWPNLGACRQLCGLESTDGEPADLIVRHEVIDRVRRGIAEHNRRQPGSSTRISRVLLLAEPPSLDAGEITAKGYINQRAALERRRDQVDTLYLAEPPESVIVC